MAKRKTTRTGPTRNGSKKPEAPVLIERPSTAQDLNQQVDHFYVNHAEVAVSHSEARIAFADLRGPESIAPRCGVVMSHLHLKRLAQALAKSVKAIESKLGPIITAPNSS